MISEREDTAKKRAKRAKGMDFDHWALVYGEDVSYLLQQVRRQRRLIGDITGYVVACHCAHCRHVVELLALMSG